MAKEKLSLNELKVQSCVTTLEEGQMTELKGGIATIRGRRFVYTTRWTAIDTRVEAAQALPSGPQGGG